MVKIVADEHFRTGSLRGYGLQRGVRIDHGPRGQKATVGDPPRAHPSVVAGDVPDQPLDRVMEVGRLVDAARHVRPQRDVLALRQVPPPQVLQHEDVALVEELGVPAQPGRHLRLAGVGVVGRALQHDRQRTVLVLRHVDLGVEPDAVPHGHHHVPFGLEPPAQVDHFPVALRLRGGGGQGAQHGCGGQDAEHGAGSATGPFPLHCRSLPGGVGLWELHRMAAGPNRAIAAHMLA